MEDEEEEVDDKEEEEVDEPETDAADNDDDDDDDDDEEKHDVDDDTATMGRGWCCFALRRGRRLVRTMLRCARSPRMPPLAQTASNASSPMAARRVEMGLVVDSVTTCGRSQQQSSELRLAALSGFRTAPSKRFMAAS